MAEKKLTRNDQRRLDRLAGKKLTYGEHMQVHNTVGRLISEYGFDEVAEAVASHRRRIATNLGSQAAAKKKPVKKTTKTAKKPPAKKAAAKKATRSS